MACRKVAFKKWQLQSVREIPYQHRNQNLSNLAKLLQQEINVSGHGFVGQYETRRTCLAHGNGGVLSSQVTSITSPLLAPLTTKPR